MNRHIMDRIAIPDRARERLTSAFPCRRAVRFSLAIFLLWPALALAAVQVRFSLDTPAAGSFPSNLFTVADPSQNTGVRVNLSFPDRAARPSDCADLAVINTLDGFNLQPRLSIPFTGPIDVNTVTSDTVFLLRLGSVLSGGDPGGQVIGINQIVWDPETNTLHVESDELLDQHTRYALIVTHGVRDLAGTAVEASGAFERFRHDLNFGQTKDPHLKEYRKALLDALAAVKPLGVNDSHIVAASVFTTQSATATLERIREQIKADTPAQADFLLGPGGTRMLFPLSTVTGITFNRQTGTAPTFTPAPVPIGMLGLVLGAVGQLGFGKYLSADYETADAEFFASDGTSVIDPDGPEGPLFEVPIVPPLPEDLGTSRSGQWEKATTRAKRTHPLCSRGEYHAQNRNSE